MSDQPIGMPRNPVDDATVVCPACGNQEVYLVTVPAGMAVSLLAKLRVALRPTDEDYAGWALLDYEELVLEKQCFARELLTLLGEEA